MVITHPTIRIDEKEILQPSVYRAKGACSFIDQNVKFRCSKTYLMWLLTKR